VGGLGPGLGEGGEKDLHLQQAVLGDQSRHHGDRSSGSDAQ
jgi:hypothetical protein